ncbi:DUF5825 family protein [Nocardia tenerifensis]|uniref:DUF5825 family protein n=1 Tax=Nocardia tenerifensis TaxID=228006 RepID=UPI0035714AD7
MRSGRRRPGPSNRCARITPLSHLHLPDRSEQPADSAELDAWWEAFYIGRCCWRQGPGFIQVRDRRRGPLAKYTITGHDLTESWYNRQKQCDRYEDELDDPRITQRYLHPEIAA